MRHEIEAIPAELAPDKANWIGAVAASADLASALFTSRRQSL
jgi:hypothetical protein